MTKKSAKVSRQKRTMTFAVASADGSLSINLDPLLEPADRIVLLNYSDNEGRKWTIQMTRKDFFLGGGNWKVENLFVGSQKSASVVDQRDSDNRQLLSQGLAAKPRKRKKGGA